MPVNRSIYQGENKTFTIAADNADTATAIVYVVDCFPQIKKTLTSGIDTATATGFNVNLSPSDTSGVTAGKYLQQVKVTASNGDVLYERQVPNSLTIRRSALENPTNGNDYQ